PTLKFSDRSCLCRAVHELDDVLGALKRIAAVAAEAVNFLARLAIHHDCVEGARRSLFSRFHVVPILAHESLGAADVMSRSGESRRRISSPRAIWGAARTAWASDNAVGSSSPALVSS